MFSATEKLGTSTSTFGETLGTTVITFHQKKQLRIFGRDRYSQGTTPLPQEFPEFGSCKEVQRRW